MCAVSEILNGLCVVVWCDFERVIWKCLQLKMRLKGRPEHDSCVAVCLFHSLNLCP